MPRRKTSNIISDVMDSAETLRKDIDAVPYEMRDKIREIAVDMISEPKKGRGRPRKKRGRPKKKRGKPRKRKKKPKAETIASL
ncbi:hypothetical protein E2P64_01860 [Candidatus Bathyarchaeota archaeon]|jgi:hypothetical protein|nr:hypothetical protein E2P64_01860 [Candidatus Bathyarchaeota archaeon]